MLPDWLQRLTIRKVLVGETASYSRIGLSQHHPDIAYVTIQHYPIAIKRWPTLDWFVPNTCHWRMLVTTHLKDGRKLSHWDIGGGTLDVVLKQAVLHAVGRVLVALREGRLAA
jgi:hypothetical protein